ncbi:hypothetical protein HMPREF0577_1504 [Mobiluncus mulieris ATCC 35243]|nr:hypothetical protein HMPREF0577_1504 [Mobiluncus mulieris ATCC 35243]
MGITVVSQQVNPHQAVLNCKIARKGEFCQLCGVQGVARGTRLHRLAHLPYGSRPTILNLRVPCWGCAACGKVWR